MHHSWSHLFYLSSSHLMHHLRLPFPDQLTSFLLPLQSFFHPLCRLKKCLDFTRAHTNTSFVVAVLSAQDRRGSLAFSEQHPPVWCVSRPGPLFKDPRRSGVPGAGEAVFLHADSLFTQSPFKIKQFNY